MLLLWRYLTTADPLHEQQVQVVLSFGSRQGGFGAAQATKLARMLKTGGP